MNPTTGKLFVWAGEQAACVRIKGRANFAIAVEFRRLLQHLRGAGYERIVLDLSDCDLMDSTFLGSLAFEARRAPAAGAAAPPSPMELWNPKPGVRELIEELGVARLFQFVERNLATADFTAAPATEPATQEELRRNCLEAHELLMAMHPDNVAKFKDVARFLVDDLKRRSASNGGPA
ncbi:MAG TPA: STAS domain-containing protein [Verrucomicrobiae bacterium]|nr:STAS domain-containing protein [Verrucomicrobiae bacterium]